jgi:hypothetical protein
MFSSHFFHRFTDALQNRSLDHNISKRSRSPTLFYQDDGAARIDTGGNARRYLKMLFSSWGVVLIHLMCSNFLYKVLKHLIL